MSKNVCSVLTDRFRDEETDVRGQRNLGVEAVVPVALVRNTLRLLSVYFAK